MTSASAKQLIDVWADLEDAYNNHHRFGGDTAEIYAHRLLPHSPSRALGSNAYESSITRDMLIEQDIQAGRDLIALLKLFEDRRKCKIIVDDTPLSAFSDQWPFRHRCHVQVVREDNVVEEKPSGSSEPMPWPIEWPAPRGTADDPCWCNGPYNEEEQHHEWCRHTRNNLRAMLEQNQTGWHEMVVTNVPAG